MQLFKRSKHNPILKPNPRRKWEALKVYNPGAVFALGKYFLLYRAAGAGINWHSSIGLATAADGINFAKHNRPILTPEFDYEKKGIEDPRLVKIDSTYYLTYTAFDGLTARMALATSQNLKTWTKHGLILEQFDFKASKNFTVPWDMAFDNPQEDKHWSKAGGIFPEKINDKFLMLFGDRNLWLAESADGLSWHYRELPFLRPRKKFFDSSHIEMGPPPIKTSKGWLVLYHGINHKIIYRLGFILLDLKNPKKILYRSPAPIFEPDAEFELNQKIDLNHSREPQVIFCNGAILKGKKLRIYYGAGDTTIGTAVCDLDKLLKNL